MFRSLQSGLALLLALLIAVAAAAGILMVALFLQSAAAQIRQADAQIERARDAVADAYRFFQQWVGQSRN